MPKPTLENLKKKTQKEYEPEPYAKYIVRPISILFTWVFVRTPISANQVTIIQEILGIIGAILLAYGKFVWGVLFLQLGYIMDCSDGEVARWKNQSSESGKFLDLIGHMIVIPFYFFGLGVGLYFHFGNPITLFAGFMAGLFSLKIEKLLRNEEGDLEIGRRGFIKSLFRYPDSMNVITILVVFDWIFETSLLFYSIIIFGIVITLGRLIQIYKTFRSIEN
jgi:phosphatidylglycerophosphate synthase